MKYEAIREYSQEFGIGKMCKALNLAASAYYQWFRRIKKKEELNKERQSTIKKVIEIFEDSHRTYGYRRMWIAVNKKGISLTEYMVRKIMRENGLYPVNSVKYKPYRKGRVLGNYFENIVDQKFNPKKLNEIWAGDITYIKTKLGWVYLAVVIDLYNREIIGYSISKSIDTELVKRAYANALANTCGGEKGTIFHSDRGTQYSSKSFQNMLLKHGFVGSMSKPGCPYDNACVESFFSTAKRECLYRKEYVTMEEVKTDLFYYIELFYNRKRMHKTLGYMSPVEYRQTRIA